MALTARYSLLTIESRMKYSVKLISTTGEVSYLSYKGALSWSKKTALKYAKEFTDNFGGFYEVHPELST